MTIDFAINVESIDISENELETLSDPIFSRPHIQVNEQALILDVCNIACYKVLKGNHIQIHPYKDAEETAVNLFLNGSILGAVLHQRGILPFHGNSFVYGGKGIIICGVPGVGKSAVTEAFCQNDGQLINDDISPVRMDEERFKIIPIKSRIKLWHDSLEKLNIKNDHLERIRSSFDKFYLPAQEKYPHEHQLDQIFILNVHSKDEFEVHEINGLNKFILLRRMIYRRFFLNGMPETGKAHFKQLIQLAEIVRVTQIIRPQNCNIYDTMEFIKEVIV
ncbi:MAG: hypothetical protein PHS30_01065 [Bacteroidales bacterium]|nr:hypothetical protein [Bacteroidales bacterium]